MANEVFLSAQKNPKGKGWVVIRGSTKDALLNSPSVLKHVNNKREGIAFLEKAKRNIESRGKRVRVIAT